MTSFAFPLTALATLFAAAILLWTALKVGGARARFGIKAPATTGNPDFERVFRVQMNTLEQFAIFLPVLWIVALTFGDIWAAAAGALWGVARILYALGYYKEASKREAGAIISGLTVVALLVAGLVGIVLGLI